MSQTILPFPVCRAARLLLAFLVAYGIVRAESPLAAQAATTRQPAPPRASPRPAAPPAAAPQSPRLPAGPTVPAPNRAAPRAPAAAAPVQSPAVSDLIAALESGDAAGRMAAADALGDLGPKAAPAVTALTKALKAEDTALRWHAARSLGEVGVAAAPAADALVAVLSDADARVRANAARSLGQLGAGASRAVPALVKATTDSEPLVRRAAVHALLELKPDKKLISDLVVKLLEDPHPSVVLPALATLSENPQGAVPILIAALKSEKARYWATVGLTELGVKAAPAVSALTGVLTDNRPQVRMHAALALGEIGPQAHSAADGLIKALEDEQMSVRYAAAYALGRIGKKESLAALETAAKSEDVMLKLLASVALAEITPDNRKVVEQAVDAILSAMQSKEAGIRLAAVRSMIRLKAPSELVRPVMEQAFGDLDPQVVADVMNALVAQGAAAVPRVINGLKSEKLRVPAVQVLTRIGPGAQAAVPALIEAMKSDNEEFRRDVHLALAAIGPAAAPAVPALTAVLSDEKSEAVQPSAAFALGRIGPAAKGAVPVLRQKLAGAKPLVKLASAWALRKIAPQDNAIRLLAAPLFVEALSSEREDVRAEAAAALGETGLKAPNVIAALKKASADESALVRQAAAESLKKLGS